MIGILSIFITTIVLMILSILFFPTIKIKKVQVDTYWIITLLGALLMLAFRLLSVQEVWASLTKSDSINPLKILVLFFSMTFLSIFLDELGFFRYLANKATSLAKGNQSSIFTFLFLAISLLTVFTSNDIIILTFTPFICYLAKRLKVNPIPYLISEFVAANTFSMTFIIGNPTNIYLGLSAGLSFFAYLKVMAPIAIITSCVSYLLLRLIFYKDLKKPIEKENEELSLCHPFLLISGIIHLGLCTFLMAISSYINLEMWLISLIFAVSLLLLSIGYILIKRDDFSILPVMRRLPYPLIPFLLSMFVLVLGLSKYEVTNEIEHFLGNEMIPYTYGFSSLLVGNLMNNIPMTVLYSSIVDLGNLKMVYASIIGSNLCAIITPLGSLAGIMWMGILKKNDVQFNFLDFMKYGIFLGLPLALVAFSLLFLFL